jgi:hypothetical protein
LNAADDAMAYLLKTGMKIDKLAPDRDRSAAAGMELAA